MTNNDVQSTTDANNGATCGFAKYTIFGFLVIFSGSLFVYLYICIVCHAPIYNFWWQTFICL